MKKKFLSIMLAMLMVFNVAAPVIASANEQNDRSLMEEYQEMIPQLSQNEMLKGATILEENKVKNVPLMKAYQEDIMTL
ncbi:MAG: CAMP factor (Cfa), partial [Finegoldia magna]|nr:CAMP factor (Cfa) [Finegoldia magna]